MDRTGRHPRFHIPNSIHHVMIRGNNRQLIFYQDIYFNKFLEIISESAEKFDHKIIAYCLMNNHAHLLIHIQNSPLSSIMQKINYRYARWFNFKEKRIGHLFQGRYRSLHVNNDEYLVNVCRYIHFNPVSANIVNKPSEYRWSSHQYYIDQNPPGWMDINLMLSIIKDKTNLTYHDFMNTPIDRETWKPALYISETGDILCYKDQLSELQRKDSISIPIVSEFLSAKQVIDVVCGELNIQKAQLLGPSKNHEVVKKRILLADYLLRYSNKNVTSIAKLLHRSQGTLSRQLKHFNQKQKNYFSDELLKNIERSLNNCLTT